MAKNNPKFHATVAARQGWGYLVQIVGPGGIVEEYTAGDCRWDSQVYAAGQLRYSTLRKHACQTAHEMLTEWGCPDGKITYDRDILPEDTAERGPCSTTVRNRSFGSGRR